MSDSPNVFVAHREQTLQEIEFAYDPERQSRNGNWTHDCGADFAGNGRALHEPGCPVEDYTGCTYHFGPVEVEKVKRWAETHDGNEDYPVPNGKLTLAILRIKFPQLV